MSLIRWNANRGLASLADDAERFFRGYGLDEANFDTVWYPSVDVSETDNAYEVKAEIPGMKKDDIKVSLEDNVLTLKGERKEESETKKKNIQICERYYGRFQRSFRLPREVKSDGIKAAYKDGVLTVEIPKAEETKPKEIEVS
jgi:HSP20 family protein